MAESPVLICTAGALCGQRIHIPEGGLDLGRSEENHVVIRDDGVSRFHANLLFDNGSVWLRDAGSRNGVYVNGSRVTQHKALKVGDTLRIALHEFTVSLETAGALPETPRPADRQPSSGADDTTADVVEPNAPTPHKRWYWPF